MRGLLASALLLATVLSAQAGEIRGFYAADTGPVPCDGRFRWWNAYQNWTGRPTRITIARQWIGADPATFADIHGVTQIEINGRVLSPLIIQQLDLYPDRRQEQERWLIVPAGRWITLPADGAIVVGLGCSPAPGKNVHLTLQIWEESP